VTVSATPLASTVGVTPAASTLDSGSTLSVPVAVTGAGVTPTGRSLSPAALYFNGGNACQRQLHLRHSG